MHATEFLKNPAKHSAGPMVVVFGSERSLKQSALAAVTTLVVGTAADDASVTKFSGLTAELKSVRDELFTVSMWGDKRLVIVEDADDFVSEHRVALEKYLDHPSKKAVLVLDVKSWPKTTRLAKRCAEIGLTIECSELKGAELMRWIQETCRAQHSKVISREASQLLSELAGNALGLLEQELAKLSAYVGTLGRIEPEDVRKLVGGWKAETTWAMIDAVRDGRLGLALSHLERLLVAGEAPLKVFGGIAFVFRKLSHAVELSQQGATLAAALQRTGVFPKDVSNCERYLRRIGRVKAGRLLPCLLEADGNLKGGSRLPERLQLERLLVQLSGQT